MNRFRFNQQVLFALLIAVMMPAVASAYTLTCKSKDFKYNLCQTNGQISRAVMKKQLSSSSCIYGRSWGYQGWGLWVNYGCAADFEVTTFGPPAPNPYPPNPFPPYPPPPPAPNPAPWPNQVPSWAIGRWQTTTLFRGEFRYIQIYPGGSAVYYGPDGPAQGYWYQDSIRFYDGNLWPVTRDRYTGQMRINVSNATQLIFRRVG